MFILTDEIQFGYLLLDPIYYSCTNLTPSVRGWQVDTICLFWLNNSLSIGIETVFWI